MQKLHNKAKHPKQRFVNFTNPERGSPQRFLGHFSAALSGEKSVPGDKANGECRAPTAECPKFVAGDHGFWDLFMNGYFDGKRIQSLGTGRLILQGEVRHLCYLSRRMSREQPGDLREIR